MRRILRIAIFGLRITFRDERLANRNVDEVSSNGVTDEMAFGGEIAVTIIGGENGPKEIKLAEIPQEHAERSIPPTDTGGEETRHRQTRRILVFTRNWGVHI
jgi:hypothetical protein